jgi:hypothetical protein
MTEEQERRAVFKAKALAFDLLETAQPWLSLEDGSFAVRIKDPAKFAKRSSVAYVVQERYKNRDNILLRI